MVSQRGGDAMLRFSHCEELAIGNIITSLPIDDGLRLCFRKEDRLFRLGYQCTVTEMRRSILENWRKYNHSLQRKAIGEHSNKISSISVLSERRMIVF
jgi:hypothetical protein